MTNLICSNFFTNIAKIFSSPAYLSDIGYGLLITLLVSLGAALLGCILGTVVAFVNISQGKSVGMKILKQLCNLYVTVIRGTPMALQLFIMYFVILAFRGFPAEITAILAFGINSGAYVAENIRAGILSVDYGQTEAGRALGLGYTKTMVKIVIPQAVKNVIPAMCNEFIALIKETSIVGMIGMFDLTQAAKILAAGDKLASYLEPMLVVALFYLAIVYLLTFVIKKLERRLRAGDKR